MPRSGAGRPRQGRGSFTPPVERRLIPGRAYDLLGVGHLAASPEGVLLCANPGLAAMLGYDTLDDLALDCEGRVVALWEELGDWEAFASLLATRGGLAQYPAVLRRRGGSFLPCAAWGRLIDWPGVEGRVVEAVFQSEAETHQAFTALTQVLRLHRDMMDLNPDPVLIHQSGLVLLANPAAEAFFGSPGRGSLVGLATEELFEPRSAAWLSRRVRDASRGQPQAGECRLVLANGEEHWVRGFNAAVTFHNRPATLTLLHERTERHRAEAALAEAEFLYRSVAEHSPDPIVIHRDGRLLYANPAAVSFVSSSGPEGLVGRELQDLFHAQSHPLLAGRLREIASSTGVTESEYTVLLGSGGERHIFARSVLVEYQGRTAILSMLQDRTGRRVAEQAKAEAESLNNIIVETAPDPVFIYEPGRLLFANRATARFFRVPSVSALMDLSMEELFDPESVARIMSRSHAILARDSGHEFLTMVRLRSGEELHYIASTVPIQYQGRRCLLAFLRDLTDIHAAQQAQAEAERLYRDVLENMPASVCLHDAGRIVYANSCMRRQFAPRETGDIAGRPVLDFIHPDSHAVYQRRRAEVLAGQYESAGEYQIGYADGRLRHVVDKTIAVDIQGRQVFLSIVQDVTERVNAERARVEAENIYQAMVENSPSPMCIVEPGRFLVANQALAGLYQVGSVAELLGATMDGLVDEESAARIKSASAKVLEGGEISDQITSFRLRSGEVRHCHSVVVPIRYQGRPCMLVTMRDLTAHHAAQQALAEAEALYRTMVETMPDPLFIHEKGVILYANPAAVAFLQRADSQDCVGKRLQDMLPPESHAVLAARLRTALAYPGGSEAEYSLTMPGGAVRHIHARSAGVEYRGSPATVVLFHDLTQRKLAETERDRALAQYEDLFQFAPMGIGVGLPSGRIERVNRHLAAMFGYPSPEAMVAEVNDIARDMFADPEDCVHLRRLAEQQDALMDFECLAKRRDGSVFWTSRCVRVVRGPDGEVRGYEGFIRDISARKQAEAERDQALAQYEDLFQFAPLGIAVGLPNDRLLQVNRRMAEMFGYPSPEAMRAEVKSISEQMYADPGEYARLRSLVESQGVVRNYECLARRRDGTAFWTSRSIRVFCDGEGQPLAFEAFLQDITQRRRAEAERDRALARHEDLFQFAPLGIGVDLPNGRIERANRHLAEMFGYASSEAMAAEIENIPAQLYANPEDFDRVRRLAEHQDEVKDFECLARRQDGSVFWTSRCVRVVRGPDGEMQGFEVFVQDISARRQAMEEARVHGRRVQVLSAELAMAGERERRTLARDLHDGPVQLLALATLMIEDLARRGKRASRFAPALDLLRQAADQFRLALEDLAPPAVLGDDLADALHTLGRDFRARYGLEVAVSCPDLPVLSREAVSFLYRAARELLVNAIKHGRASRAEVRVELEGHVLRLMVEDQGQGFNPALFWDENVRSLGLPSLRNLARDLGGGMALDSSPGAGTRVVLMLPMESLCEAPQPREALLNHE